MYVCPYIIVQFIFHEGLYKGEILMRNVTLQEKCDTPCIPVPAARKYTALPVLLHVP